MGVTPGAAWEEADAAAIAAIAARFTGTPLLAGLAGAQGSGKTTMAPRLARALAARGLIAIVLALDDFYLTRVERLALAKTVHPLLATRGVPGTHDLALLDRTLAHLLGRHPADVAIPRFDKAADDRAPEARRVSGCVDVVILEGWCVGAQPQPSAQLERPVNMLEAEEDGDGRWRRWVNVRLATDYAALFEKLDCRIYLRAPDFGVVHRWRNEQELALASGGLSETELIRFIAHYERITRAMLADPPAELVIELDVSRTPFMRE